MTGVTKRDEEIRVIWTENQWLYLVVGFLGGVLFCLLVQLSVLNLPELVQNLIPELTGIFITITVIDQMNRRRDERNAIKQLQEQLVRDASSRVNDIANNAVHQLLKRGWLEGEDGLLAGADLRWSNLQKAHLANANLREANLSITKLQEAALGTANLQRAVLKATELQRADLMGANLQKADLMGANLTRAKLMFTNLKGADLTAANLENALLYETKFDENTILPDGTLWTSDTDMTKFTWSRSNAKAE